MRLWNLTLDTFANLLRWKEMKLKEGPKGKANCIAVPSREKPLKGAGN